MPTAMALMAVDDFSSCESVIFEYIIAKRVDRASASTMAEQAKWYGQLVVCACRVSGVRMQGVGCAHAGCWVFQACLICEDSRTVLY